MSPRSTCSQRSSSQKEVDSSLLTEVTNEEMLRDVTKGHVFGILVKKRTLLNSFLMFYMNKMLE